MSLLFVDVEGNDFLHGLKRLWTIQIATDARGPVTVYADQPGFPPLSEGLAILKAADKMVIHFGLGFDYWAINLLYPGTLRWTQVIDSLVLARMIAPTKKGHSLKDVGDAVKLPKGELENFAKFSQEMVEYGIRDVEILQRAWIGTEDCPSFGDYYKRFPAAVETEMSAAYLVAMQERHGFRFEYEKAVELESELRQEAVDITRRLREVFPAIVTERFHKRTGKPLSDDVETFNPGSRDQIAKRLIDKYNWKPHKKTPSGKWKIDEEVLAYLPWPEAKLCVEYMAAGKKLGQLSDGKHAWMKVAEKKDNGDYVIHGRVNSIGARTFRMAHYQPNVAQADSDPRMRELWVPDRGHLLVGVDAEGLELRMLAHFLAMYDEGTYAKIVDSGDSAIGTDVHTTTQRIVGLYLRSSAKRLIFAFCYGAGDAMLGSIICDDAREAGKPEPAGTLYQIGSKARAKLQAGIVGLDRLINKCAARHAKYAAMPGLDGRWIPSASEHSALNTLLQGNGAITMKVAKYEFHREMDRLQLLDRFGYCADVHDEWQFSAEPEYAEKVAETGKWAIAKAGEVQDLRCPLKGKAVIGSNWRETH